MKNPELAKLNFRTLLHYSNIPVHGSRSSFPIKCTGFCVSCEKNGFLDNGDFRLNKMSHAADTEDFEKSICDLPPGGLDVSVAFLLESPGGGSSLGEPIKYVAEGITKRPPNGQYYWTTPQPDSSSTDQTPTWPKDASELKNLYGDYFAHLIWTHKFHNAYFTNIVKCNLTKRDNEKFIRYEPTINPDNRDFKILTNCCRLFLNQEMTIIDPAIIFYFGKKSKSLGDYAELNRLLPAAQMVTLWHPAAHCSPSQIVSHNDKLIRAALDKLK